MLGPNEMLAGYWEALVPMIINTGFSVGETKGTSGRCASNTTRFQSGMLRFNCADSLDRTNVASFFAALQVLLRQCGHLGIIIEADTSATQGENSGSHGRHLLPPGWECRVDPVTKKQFFIDHMSRTTTWTHPGKTNDLHSQPLTADLPFCRDTVKLNNVDCLRNRLSPRVVSALSDLFQGDGDFHATCYTGTKAMHSDLMNILKTAKTRRTSNSAVNTASNLGITIHRRFTNIVSDKYRQMQMELFLGKGLHSGLEQCMSQEMANPVSLSVLRALPQVSTAYVLPPKHLFSICAAPTDSPFNWEYPSGMVKVDLVAKLDFVNDVGDLFFHGYTLKSLVVDIRVGETLDGLNLQGRRVSVPHCAFADFLRCELREFCHVELQRSHMAFELTNLRENRKFSSNFLGLSFYSDVSETDCRPKELVSGSFQILGSNLNLRVPQSSWGTSEHTVALQRQNSPASYSGVGSSQYKDHMNTATTLHTSVTVFNRYEHTLSHCVTLLFSVFAAPYGLSPDALFHMPSRDEASWHGPEQERAVDFTLLLDSTCYISCITMKTSAKDIGRSTRIVVDVLIGQTTETTLVQDRWEFVLLTKTKQQLTCYLHNSSPVNIVSLRIMLPEGTTGALPDLHAIEIFGFPAQTSEMELKNEQLAASLNCVTHCHPYSPCVQLHGDSVGDDVQG
mmetsp:Transcript_2253/g.7898  ORF Transcript_2253/g.7898 Transcript_2253/m.7898 type:complete len:678 (+) Transcript_2253:1549-3582(+)